MGLGGKQDAQPDFGMDAGLPMDASPKMPWKSHEPRSCSYTCFFVLLNPFMAPWKIAQAQPGFSGDV